MLDSSRSLARLEKRPPDWKSGSLPVGRRASIQIRLGSAGTGPSSSPAVKFHGKSNKCAHCGRPLCNEHSPARTSGLAGLLD
jgi:hypothetical protein